MDQARDPLGIVIAIIVPFTIAWLQYALAGLPYIAPVPQYNPASPVDLYVPLCKPASHSGCNVPPEKSTEPASTLHKPSPSHKRNLMRNRDILRILLVPPSNKTRSLRQLRKGASFPATGFTKVHLGSLGSFGILGSLGSFGRKHLRSFFFCAIGNQRSATSVMAGIPDHRPVDCRHSAAGHYLFPVTSTSSAGPGWGQTVVYSRQNARKQIPVCTERGR